MTVFLAMIPNVGRSPLCEINSQNQQKCEGLVSATSGYPLELEVNKTWGTMGDDEFHSMVLDSEENIYVTGMTDWDIVTNKYNSSFDLEWSRVYSNANGQDYGDGIAVDSNKNIYTVGKLSPNDDSYSYLAILKYNNSGDLKWMRNWGGVGNVYSYGHTLVIDSMDNIYVAGETNSMGVGGYDICVIKYNNTGHEQWYTLWGGLEDEYCKDMALDNEGNLYLIGYTKSFGATISDVLVIKYISSGVQQWNRTWSGPDADVANSLVLDSSNNICLCGQFKDNDGYWDAFLLKYNPNGDLIWSRTWGEVSKNEVADGLTIDNFNQLYFTSYENQPYTGFDIVILSYSSEGDYNWEYIWGTSGFDLSTSLAFISPNKLYLAGVTTGLGLGGEDGLLLQFSIHPILRINSPALNQFFSTSPPAFVITVISHYLDSIWYTFDNDLTNFSIPAFSGTINSTLWNSLGDGSYNVFFYANDSSGEICFSNITIHKDVTSPASILHFIPYKGTNKVNISTQFTIQSDDGIGSGVQIIRWRINGSSWTTATYGLVSGFYLNPNSLPGFYLIEFYAIDEIGNSEGIQSVLVELVNIDVEQPSIPGYNIILMVSIVSLGVIFFKKKSKFFIWGIKNKSLS